MISGIYWRGSRPTLELIEDDGASHIDLKPGQRIKIQLQGTRKCIGTYDWNKQARVGCVYRNAATIGRSQCSQCERIDTSYAAKTGFSRNVEEEELLSSPHFVYIALFGRDVIKVGVARQDRFPSRIYEQGAWAAQVVKSTDGKTARVIERSIHTELQFPEAVQIERKIALFEQMQSKEETIKKLDELTSDDALLNLTQAPQNRVTFVYSLPAYNIPDIHQYASVYLVKNLTTKSSLAGTFMGFYGKFLLVTSLDNLYVIQSKELEGYDSSSITSWDDNFAKELELKRIIDNRQIGLL